MSTTRVTTLTYEAQDGTMLAQAVHKSLDHKARGLSPQGYADATEWTIMVTGPFDWQRDGGRLPAHLRDYANAGMPLEHAADLVDVTEALARVGHALETFQQEIKDADTALSQRLAAAQAYGKVQELPIEQVQS